MNIEDAEDVAHEYGITAVPTFMLFKDGDLMPEKSVLGPHAQKIRDMVAENVKV
jgi:thioredoxin-like negative regulator of GroEL